MSGRQIITFSICFILFLSAGRSFDVFLDTTSVFFLQKAIISILIGALTAKTLFEQEIYRTLDFQDCVSTAHLSLPLFFSSTYENSNFYSLGICLSVLGTWITGISVLYLWPNFLVFPQNQKDISVDGIYRFVRHPIYLGYVISFFSVTLIHPNFFNCTLFIFFLGLTCLRIAFEEKHLSESKAYQEFKKRTQFKLLPFIY